MLCAVSPSVHHPQPLKELPPADEPFKDKFLVQSCQTDAADTDDAKIIFENTDKNSIIDQKLLCTFNTPDGEMPQPGPSDTLVSPLGWVFQYVSDSLRGLARSQFTNIAGFSRSSLPRAHSAIEQLPVNYI